jgi:hypothetical protein
MRRMVSAIAALATVGLFRPTFAAADPVKMRRSKLRSGH